MNTIEWFNRELKKRYGSVKRARGCYWYTEKGTRLTDLWQEDGRAILGWGNANAKSLQIFKNIMSRGQTGSFTTDYEQRFTKALLSILPKKYNTVRWFSSPKEIDELPLWRPWDDIFSPKGVEAVAFQIPMPFASSFYCAAYSDAANQIPCSDAISPVFLGAGSRAIYDLIAAIPKKNEGDFKKYDDILSLYFKRAGPYLKPIVNEKVYALMVLHFLDCGIILNPEFRKDSIIPFDANRGDFSALSKKSFLS